MRVLAPLILACSLFLNPLVIRGQGIADTTIALTGVQANYAQQLPGGDLADRFGTNSNLSLGAFRKFRSNITVGVEGGFLFGDRVIEPGILGNIINSQGQIVDAEGVMADVFLFQRGWTAFVTAGRILPWFGPNPNSGLHLKVGAGMLRHKVRVQTQKNLVPQLEDEYLEGYDRLTAGPAALAYLGYQHFGNKHRVNFHIGLELTVGFTQPLRPFNFDTEEYNKNNRIDLLSAIRAGWTLPIHRKADTGFHYY